MSDRISQLFERQMLIRLCVMLAVGFGALFAALRYWPPHG